MQHIALSSRRWSYSHITGPWWWPCEKLKVLPTWLKVATTVMTVERPQLPPFLNTEIEINPFKSAHFRRLHILTGMDCCSCMSVMFADARSTVSSEQFRSACNRGKWLWQPQRWEVHPRYIYIYILTDFEALIKSAVDVSSVCPRIRKPGTVMGRINALNAGLKVLCDDLEVEFIDNHSKNKVGQNIYIYMYRGWTSHRCGCHNHFPRLQALLNCSP